MEITTLAILGVACNVLEVLELQNYIAKTGGSGGWGKGRRDVVASPERGAPHSAIKVASASTHFLQVS